ncbi:hypothetical protein FACS1894156_8650 [Bacteroidia bacterium]|nr:hypothetical protein FACS1894156_8650 [Bacteroidia bacterium]
MPSLIVNPGDVVGVREKAKSLEVVQEHCGTARASRYPWLEWDSNSLSGKFLSRPERADIPEPVHEQLIVELYSK